MPIYNSEQEILMIINILKQHSRFRLNKFHNSLKSIDPEAFNELKKTIIEINSKIFNLENKIRKSRIGFIF